MSKKDIKSVKTVFADVEALAAIMQSCMNLVKKVGNKLSIPTELRPAPAEFGRPSGGGKLATSISGATRGRGLKTGSPPMILQILFLQGHWEFWVLESPL
ncbi:hypothetical protein GcM3_045010 [Golovinomyces cichoracearum]|uniref:Uncharacterized protein n=1 Tax=Golovinomyces cichoracearum TaxID=62708 RepID=A0A420J0U2_9PEZI|nr:hypothetical protein GcM3_045010 [Golovinomyces cichoracearum]